jgi:DNA-3-methyladenine glycosylase
MRLRRGAVPDALLCSGPGRLAQALGIGPGLDGEIVGGEHIAFVPPVRAVALVTAPRVGISRAIEQPWRYLTAGSPFASSPRPWARRRRPRG